MCVSVIIPVYNACLHIKACLDSVLSQSGADLEIVCVDDGSTDGGSAWLDWWSVGRPNVYVVHQPNAGQGAARNSGLERATGDYVYFMDADDALAVSNALSRLVDVMDRDRLDVLFFDARTEVDADAADSAAAVRASDYVRTHDYSRVQTGPALFSSFLKNREFCVSPCLMLLRRSFVEESQLRFPTERIFYEDNVFMTRVLLAAKRASHRSWQLYVRKVHARSTVTSKPTLRHLRGYLACYRDVCDLIARYNWDWRTRSALVERRVVYKLHVRRLSESWPNLVAEMKQTCTAGEYAELQGVLRYPLGEKAVNAVRCLRDRGLAFTVRRILFGRRKA